jgi:hypothetical protein
VKNLKINGSLLNLSALSENKIELLKCKFNKFGYVKLHYLFSDIFFKSLKKEVNELRESSTNRNFLMPDYNTPRVLSVLGAKKINQKSTLLPKLYCNKALQKCISKIAGKPIYSISHTEESMVINFIEKNGGTHGWHLDDPKYALVIIIEAPDSSSGGYLEIIPHYKKLAKNRKLDPVIDAKQLVTIANDEGLIRKISHLSGECYLLNAADCLHRVAPVTKDTYRTVINFAFDSNKNVDYGDTANALYADALDMDIHENV